MPLRNHVFRIEEVCLFFLHTFSGCCSEQTLALFARVVRFLCLLQEFDLLIKDFFLPEWV